MLIFTEEDYRAQTVRLTLRGGQEDAMDELIKLVTEKAHISEDQARTAVTAVLDFLKAKLPAPVASQIDGLLSSNMAGNLGDAAKGLGGLFGRK